MDSRTLKKIYKIFRELAEINKSEPFKRAAYLKAIRIIKTLEVQKNTDILLNPDVKIPGLGVKLRDKIFEIKKTGKLTELSQLNKSTKTPFDNIRGFSSTFINKLLAQGITTITQLKKSNINLTHEQELGLKYHKDLEKKIPRTEITKYTNIIDDLIDSLKYGLIIGGSYRRGKSQSGDIDLVLYKKNSNKIDNYLEELIFAIDNSPKVKLIGIFMLGKHRFSGLINNNHGLVRQLDIIYVPESELITAIMHSTGSAAFNQEIRAIAKKKGYKLNEKGLFKGNRRISIRNEQDIFNILNIPYVSLELRN